MFKSVFKKSLYITFVMSAPIAYAMPDLTGWQHVSTSNTVHIYMSPKYMSKVGHKKVEAWETFVFYQNDVDMQMYIGEYSKSLVVYDCATRSFGTKQRVSYTQTGQVKLSGSILDYQVKMQRVIPQSVGETQLNYACSQFGW
ncbi:surface-adhesin E family protein [Moraxella sp. VT-16-12]|uniref:surface-adhesin E family protein n=1 Tax=Moraxella sp. VT-16-12 TaxID=2014877 RepID=UPI000B7FD30D|nr:surface-adhesin E family protein [Moraxella sp. VT-16-12]TWV84865.1 hypothetical protein CEW93_001435 [Moraxella sp. VT-16-12]